ncbi:MAG TPA: PrsW family glutamic-type intramembrane protease [Chitinophagaceae bacterium]|nr:PrsW family glutamic-type intramembrane protease [Chitinophagaceae bacterium]
MLLLALSIAPGLAIILYVYRKDSYDREPKRYLLVSFFLGMLSVIPAFILEKAGGFIFGNMGRSSSISFYAFFAFVVVAASEEASKFAAVKWYAYPKKYFDEPFDGIMYSVMVAMGFATVENIGYVQQHGFGTAILRMFLSVPAHAAFGIIMGYYIGLAKFNKEKSTGYLITGLLLAVFFHGAFDFFLFLQDSIKVKEYVSEGLLFLGAIASFYFAVRLSLRSIRLHRELSRIDFEKRNKQV